MSKLVILVATANPDGTGLLSTSEEVKAIQDGLNKARNHNPFGPLQFVPQASASDLISAIQFLRPHVVHFSGHGTEAEGLLFAEQITVERYEDNVLVERNQANKRQAVDAPTLAEIFRYGVPNLRLVVLNACYSASQALAITQFVDCVVGIAGKTHNRYAEAFARGFYESLANGYTVGDAVSSGQLQWKLVEGMAQPQPVVEMKLKPGLEDVGKVFVSADNDSAVPVNGIADTASKPDNARGALERVPACRPLKENWEERPVSGAFYGRSKELAELKTWVVTDRCRLVALVGQGGVGKTALAVQVAQWVKSDFQYLFQRSLKNAPEIGKVIGDCIKFVSDQRRVESSTNLDEQIAVLLEFLRERRCLLLLDNAESILDGHQPGHYLEHHKAYGTFIRRLASEDHNSCLLITSRELAQDVGDFADRRSPVRKQWLNGLGHADARRILEDREGLTGKQADWLKLTAFYAGNPLAMRLVAAYIARLHGGDIAAFMESGHVVFDRIESLLAEQFQRLLPLEEEILFWLAIEREPISGDDLRTNILAAEDRERAPDSLFTLQDRCLIEQSLAGTGKGVESTAKFTLQPVILEFVTGQLIERAADELNAGALRLLNHVVLVKSRAKEYIRNSQGRLIIEPTIESCRTVHHIRDVREHLSRILVSLRRAGDNPRGYAAGNLVNLLCHVGRGNLNSLELRGLVIRQAYLRDALLQGARLDDSELIDCVFADTFGIVWSVALGDSDRLLAAGTTTGEIRLWDTDRVQQRAALLGHTGWIFSIAFSPDGGMLVSGSGDQTVRVWDTRTGLLLHSLAGHSSRVRGVAWHPTIELLASGSEDRTVRLWSRNNSWSGRILYAHENRVLTVAFSPDGRFLASGGVDKRVLLWDLNAGQLTGTIAVDMEIRALAFSADGKNLAICGADHIIRLCNVSTLKVQRELEGHSELVRSVAFGSDGVLASGSDDKTIRLWDSIRGECRNTLEGHAGRIRSVAFGSTRPLLASGGEDQTVRLWDVETAQNLATLRGFSSQVLSVCFASPHLLATGHDDSLVRLWDTNTGEELRTLSGHSSRVWSVAGAPETNQLASAGDDAKVCVWDLTTNHCVRVFIGHRYRIFSVAFGPQGDLLASGGEDRVIRLWDVRSGCLRRSLSGHEDRVMSVNFAPRGNRLATGSEDRTVRIWDVESGEGCVLGSHDDKVTSVAFDPEGKYLASGSEDRTVRIWCLNTGKAIHVLEGHSKQVRALAYSPTGEYIVSGSEDGAVIVWDAATGQKICGMKEHAFWVESVAIDSSGVLIASGSDDEKIVLWDYRTKQKRKTLRSKRPCEDLTLFRTTGLSELQKEVLAALGAKFQE